MYTIVLCDKSDPIDPNKCSHKAVGKVFTVLESAQANAERRTAQIPANMSHKEYRVMPLSPSAIREYQKSSPALSVGERVRRQKAAR